MAETFATLKARLADWLNIRSTDRLGESVRGDAVNMAIRDLSRDHNLWFCEASDTFPTVASTYSYSLPARWIRPHSLWYLDSAGSKVDLTYKTKEEFDYWYPRPTTVSGKPTDYTWWGNNLILGPTPDAVYTVNRNFYQLLADLSEDGDSNVFTDNAWEAIHFKALIQLAKYLGQDGTVALFMDDAVTREQRLSAEHRRAKSAAKSMTSKMPGSRG
jgi:hypothetical protein